MDKRARGLKEVYYHSKKTGKRDYGPFKCTVVGPFHAEHLGKGEWNVGAWGKKILDLDESKKEAVVAFMRRMIDLGWPTDEPETKEGRAALKVIYLKAREEFIGPRFASGLPIGGQVARIPAATLSA